MPLPFELDEDSLTLLLPPPPVSRLSWLVKSALRVSSKWSLLLLLGGFEIELDESRVDVEVLALMTRFDMMAADDDDGEEKLLAFWPSVNELACVGVAG